MDLKERFDFLKTQKEALERTQLESKVRLESLEKQLEEELKQLKETYGVASIKEAKELYKQLSTKVSKDLEELSNTLESYESIIKDADI